MSSRLVAENTVSQGRNAQNARVKTGPDIFRERQGEEQNNQRLASLRETPREEMYRVNRDQIQRMGPGEPDINNGGQIANGTNNPRGVGAVGSLIDAWV
ncbi:hypothetical protein ACR0ST_02795 [Aliidiomarina sp. Khilg15.8]